MVFTLVGAFTPCSFFSLQLQMRTIPSSMITAFFII